MRLDTPGQNEVGRSPASGTLLLIEALRGVAATAVVLYHVGRHIQKGGADAFYATLTHVGHAGVDLFFVLSGFIILYAHGNDLGRPQRLGHYAWRRFSRVLPLYWLALLLTVLLDFASRRTWPMPAQWLQALTLHPSAIEPLVGVSWTLTHELLFYAVFGLAIIHRWLGLAALGLWALAVLAQAADPFSGLDWPIAYLRPYNLEFLMGMAAAGWVRRWPVSRPWPWLLSGLLSFVVAAVLENQGWLGAHDLPARLIYGPASMLLVIGAAARPSAAEFAPPAWLLALGSASYAIYLFQFIFIGILWKPWTVLQLDRHLGWAISFVALTLLALLGGVLISRLVEQPLLAWLRNWRSRGAGVASQS